MKMVVVNADMKFTGDESNEKHVFTKRGHEECEVCLENENHVCDEDNNVISDILSQIISKIESKNEK